MTCITHYHGCDCREAAHNAELERSIRDHENCKGYADALKFETERLKYELDAMTMFRDGRVQEIERLNEQVARLSEAGRLLVERWDTPLWKDVPHTAQYISVMRSALDSSASDWLAKKLQEARDEVLENAIVQFANDKGYGDWTRDFIARDLRAMKSKEVDHD